MKKVLALLLALAMLVAVAGCGGGAPASSGADASTPDASAPESGGADAEGSEIAMITDVGTIDDKSFNQGTWEGVVQYATENNITHKYYKPAEKTDAAYLDAISLAIKGGAKVVVTPGFLFEPAIFQAQDLYPETTFILLDGAPNNGATDDTREERIEKNVYSIFYAEEQAGYLAGYAAVKDGNRKLGFMGGMAVPAVVRFGLGYVQGAEAAASELGLAAGEVEIKYTYVGNFDATPENQTLAASWYNDGTEVIFACGGAVGNSVMAAAAASEGKKVIGVDVDQSAESDTVITSAMKMLGNSVAQALASYYDGSFPGGVIATLDATTNSVGLPMENSRFETFSQADYDAVYAKLVDGSVTLKKDTDVTEGNASELGMTLVTVTMF